MDMQSELRVAVQTQGPPFSFVDKQGNRTGSSVEFCRLMPNAKIKEYKGGGNIAMNAAAAGHADVGIGNLNSVHAMASSYPAGTLTILPTMLSYDPLSFAVRSEDRHLLEWVNLLLARLNPALPRFYLKPGSH